MSHLLSKIKLVFFSFLTYIIVLFFTIAVFSVDFLDQPYYEYLASLKIDEDSLGDDRIVLVLIDETAIKDIGSFRKIPRDCYTRLLQRLNQARPRVVALDITFHKPSEERDDEDLAEAMQFCGNIVIAAKYESDQNTGRTDFFLPVTCLQESSETSGFTNLPLTKEKIRYADHVIDDLSGKTRGYSFSLAVASTYLNKHFKACEKLDDYYLLPRSSFEPIRIPVNSNGLTLINYVESGKGYQTLSFLDVLAGKFNEQVLEDKIVLVGGTGGVFEDRYFTPLNDLADGVRIHANIIDNLINEEFTGELTYNGKVFLVTVVAFIGHIIFCLCGLVLSGFLTILLSGSCFLVSGVMIAYGLYVNPIPLVITLGLSFFASILIKMLFVKRERERTLQVFFQYISPTLARELLERPDLLKLGGERRMVTVLFCDIRGFTPLCESIQPEEVMDLLNEIFQGMSDIIFENGGIIDKFVGDQIMALFGVPEEHEDDPERAIRAAIKMRNMLRKKSWREREHKVDVGIGVSTGYAVIGNVGSDKHKDFTAIGDSINIAARLQAKAGAGEVLITENTYHYVENVIAVEELGEVHVKGRKDTIRVFRVTDYLG